MIRQRYNNSLNNEIHLFTWSIMKFRETPGMGKTWYGCILVCTKERTGRRFLVNTVVALLSLDPFPLRELVELVSGLRFLSKALFQQATELQRLPRFAQLRVSITHIPFPLELGNI